MDAYLLLKRRGEERKGGCAALEAGKTINYWYKSLLLEVLAQPRGVEMLLEGNLQLLRALAHHMLNPVVPVAILPDQLHIPNELLRTGIVVVQQSLLDRPEVHWLADDVVVVHDVELYGVDWLDEVEGALLLGAARHDLEGDLVPRLQLDALDLFLADAVRVGGEFPEFGDGVEELDGFLLGEVVRLSLLVEEDDLVALLGLLEDILLAPALLQARALVAVPQLPDLVAQEIRSVQELGALGVLDRGLVGVVDVFNIGALFEQKAAHLEVAPAGRVVERGLSDQFVDVVEPFCVGEVVPLVAYLRTISSLFSLMA